jgi:hypothetical protein
MKAFATLPEALQDGRQSPAALEICRGACRLLKAHGFAAVTEVTLANGRRADIVGVAEGGDIWIVEIKSCLDDFRVDLKWPEYREFCDKLFFAVGPAFPRDVLPPEAGVVVADRYGGEILRNAPEHRLPAARRRAVTLRIARTAALRLQTAVDPEDALEALPRV